MAEKEKPTIDQVRAAVEQAEQARNDARRRQRAHELGFDDLEMYDLWSELERLRKAALALRDYDTTNPRSADAIAARISGFPLAG